MEAGKPGPPGDPLEVPAPVGAGVSAALVSGPFDTPQNYVGLILTTLKIKPERVVSFSTFVSLFNV